MSRRQVMGDVKWTVSWLLFVVVLAACGDNVHPADHDPVTAFGFLASHNPGLASDVTATIGGTSIDATFPHGADVTALAASFDVPAGTIVTVDGVVQVSGVTRHDFSGTGRLRAARGPVYVFTSADGTVVSYSTDVTVAAPSDNALTGLGFGSAHNPALGSDVVAAINGTTVTATVPFGTDVTALVATFTTTGTNVAIGSTSQISNLSANNYSAPLTYVVTAADGATQSFIVSVTVASSSAKDLTAFALLGAHNPGLTDVTATINGTAITATVPFGTDVTALVPTFASTGMIVTVAGTPQISGATANDFTAAKTYVVTAADTTTKAFVVTVLIASNAAKDLSTFAFLSSHNSGLASDVTATINGTAITATVPFGTNVSGLVATFTTSGASVAVGVTPQTSGITPNNFTTPTTYVVMAADTTTKSFVVTVLIASNTAKDLSSFAFRSSNNAGLSADVSASFNGTAITATVPFGTDVSALVATFTTSGASVAVGGTPQISGVTANSFTTAKSYIVTASDASTKSYTVTVAIASNAAKDIATLSFLTIHNPGLAADVTATINGTAITATVPFGTNVSALIATFATTGATVTVGGTAQTSGVTANDFSTTTTYLVTASDASTKAYIVTVGIAPSGAKDLSTFAFLSSANPGLGADVVAAISGTTITATVPFGTNVSALIATFSTTGASVAIGAAPQTSGVTPNSFASSTIYTVTANDTSTKSYTVTVASAPNTAKDITTFAFLSIHNPGLAADVIASVSGATITATVPFGTNVSALIATFSTTGASVTIGGTTQTSGVTPNSFTTPVGYVVTAADNSTKPYTVTVASAPSGAKDITSFRFLSSANSGLSADVATSISGTTITATVPFGTDVTALVATYGTNGSIVDVGVTAQTSGVTANDFTSPVTYLVRAADTTTKSYSVTVTAAPSGAKDLTTFKFLSSVNSGLGADVIASISGATITATVPFGTDVTALIASFGTSGAIVDVGVSAQTSGVTQNNFAGAVTYVVHAADASTKSYTVTVTAAPSGAKDLTTFGFLSSVNSGLAADVAALVSGTTITATVPFGTDLSALIATFGTTGSSVAVGVASQTSGVTANNFTSSLTYDVTASNLSVKSYTVTVTAAQSGAKDLTTFKLLSSLNTGLAADVIASLSGTTFTATVPFGTDLSALVATFGTTGTSVAVAGTPQTSGITANNFTTTLTYDVTASNLSVKSYAVTVTAAPSGAKDLTTFKFLSATSSGLAADVTASITGTTISVAVPFGTDLSALVATFATTGTSVAVAGTPQTSGVTANSFSSTVTYVVTASDLSVKSYTVTVTAAQSGAKDITTFKFLSAANSGLGADVIATVGGTSINATVPFGTDVTALIATYGTSGSSVAVGVSPQTNGVTPNNFSSSVTYVVRAADTTTKSYTVTVTVSPSGAKDIGTFAFLSSVNSGLAADVAAGVSGTTITATVPFGTDLSALVATYGTTGASVAIAGAPQTSGISANDFTSTVTYVVSASDASTKSYTVTVTAAPSSAKDIATFAFLSAVNSGLAADVMAGISGSSITATVPFGTDISTLIPTFGTTGASVTIAGTPQVSGVTANSFASVVTYLVTAADNSTKSYTATITIAPSGAKDIGMFAFLSSANSGLAADVVAGISGTTITATVPFGTDLSALVATYGTTGASVAVAGAPQTSGVTSNNFTSGVTYLVSASDATAKSYTVTVTAAPSGAKDLATFAFLSAANSGLAADVVAGITGTSITATVPFGTDLSALVATYGTTGASVAIGGTPQTSGVTANNFSSTVTYVVTASDATAKSYTVTVTAAPSGAKDIATFAFLSAVNSGLAADVVAGITGTSITATVPFGTDVSALIPTFGTTGATVTIAGTPQVSGVTANNFATVATYLVTAADLSTKSYTVTVTAAPSGAKDIGTFAFLSSVNSGLSADVVAGITGTSITATVPFGTDVSGLIPTFGTTGATVTIAGTLQVSGVTANNFATVATYLVTAADLTTKSYTVTVTVAQSSTKDIGTFAFLSSVNSGLGADVVAGITGTSITATVPFGTDVSALIPTFGTTGATVTVGGTPQVSGVTANDFASVPTYLVTAADTTAKSYTVTVTIAPSGAKDIGSFAFLSAVNSGLAADVTAGITGTSITATVPFGTDISALIPTFGTTGATVTLAGTPQVSGVTANNFASVPTYLVTAADTTAKSYTVTVTIAPSGAKDIGAFAFLSSVNSGLSADVTAGITGTTITATVPFGTDVSALIPTFGTTGAGVTVAGTPQVSGVTVNTFASAPTYLVTAADNSTKSYTVTVTVAQNSAKDIGTLSFLTVHNGGLSSDVSAVISGTAITASVPLGTDVMGLIPTFATTGASVTVAGASQVSSVSVQDFTSPVTYVVTAADNSFQQYTVTVVVDAPIGSTYYMHKLYEQLTYPISGIATSGTDVYYLHQTSATSYSLDMVDTTGTVTNVATTGSAVWLDITVAGNYLFLLQSVTSGTTTYSVVRYQLADLLAIPATLTFPANTVAKKFASDGGGVVYVSGNAAIKGIIYFDRDAFSTVTIAKTSTVYVGLAYRSVTISSTTYGYLYGTRGTGVGAAIDEIPVATLSSGSVSPSTVFACPTEIVTPNLIKWIPYTASFLITDKNTNGSLGGGVTNGQIFSYQPTYNSGTGTLIAMGSGTLLIRGNSNSGSAETPSTTMLPANTLSTASSAYLYTASAIDYNINANGYINVFVGNGTSTAAGYLVKFYDPVVGSPLAGL